MGNHLLLPLLTPSGGHHTYGRQEGGTHPTGMHSSCLVVRLSIYIPRILTSLNTQKMRQLTVTQLNCAKTLSSVTDIGDKKSTHVFVLRIGRRTDKFLIDSRCQIYSRFTAGNQ